MLKDKLVLMRALDVHLPGAVLWLLLIHALAFPATGWGQRGDTLPHADADTLENALHYDPAGSDEYKYVEEEGAAPGLFLMALFMFALIFMLIGVGIVMAAVALFLFTGLVLLGVVSTSLLIGLKERSVAKGFQVFVILSTTLGGIAAGGLGIFVLNSVLHWWSPTPALVYGMAGGLIAGLLLGYGLAHLIHRVLAMLQRRLRITGTA